MTPPRSEADGNAPIATLSRRGADAVGMEFATLLRLQLIPAKLLFCPILA